MSVVRTNSRAVVIKVLAVLIAVSGIIGFVLGVAVFQTVDQSVEIMKMMREGGYPAMPGVDLDTFRSVMYAVAINQIITGALSAISGIGIVLRKNWARLLFLVTLVLMTLTGVYSVTMNFINQAEWTRIVSNGFILIVYAALFYFFSRKRTKEFFVRNNYVA